MRRASEIMADKPVPASKIISFWVNHLTKHGADHLRMFELSHTQFIMFYIIICFHIFCSIAYFHNIDMCVLQIQHMHVLYNTRSISLIQNRMTWDIINTLFVRVGKTRSTWKFNWLHATRNKYIQIFT